MRQSDQNPALRSADTSKAATRRQLLSRSSHLFGGAATLAGFWSSLQAAGLNASTSGTIARRAAQARSVIMIFNCGAPGHTDLWDMKPTAPADIRGEFQPIETSVPGIQISELLPDLAKRMDQLSIIRSVHHRHGGHNSGMHWSTVGKPYRIDSTLINPGPADIPCLGTLLGWLARRDGYSAAVPPYVITPAPHCDSTKYLTPGQFGGCLGNRFDPFVLNADPAAQDFRVPGLKLDDAVSPDRLNGRTSLLQALEDRGTPIRSDQIAAIDEQRRRALNMITSSDASAAFDLSREPDTVRDRYGRHSWGQSHLLARRLIEAGTRFVTTVNGPSITWDTHKDNFNQLRNPLVPRMQQAYVALLDDLAERGLLQETLVIWMGDFGRTPRINKDAGRDHWPQCYSMVLAGGGIRGGQVVGSSDSIGGEPFERPVTPADVHATVFAALGYQADQITYHHADGRPAPVCDGTPIHELL